MLNEEKIQELRLKKVYYALTRDKQYKRQLGKEIDLLTLEYWKKEKAFNQ